MDGDGDDDEEVDVLVHVLDMGIFNDQWQEQPQIFKPSGEDEEVGVQVFTKDQWQEQPLIF